jgi:hypothetical protein
MERRREETVQVDNHLGLEDVVEGRRHADGEAAAVVLRPGPRVRDAAQHRGSRFRGRRLRWRRGGRRWGRRLRGRGGGGGGGGGRGNGDGGVDSEAAARGPAAAERSPWWVRVMRQRGEREERGGGHGAAPSGGDEGRVRFGAVARASTGVISDKRCGAKRGAEAGPLEEKRGDFC